jgi:hypothetical protein
MDRQLVLAIVLIVVAGAGCGQSTVASPQGTTQYPNPASNNPAASNPAASPQPVELSGSQRLQYAWNKAMEGIAMGGAIGGPYGAGGGLIIGLIAGLLTADSHYTALNNQIYTEQQKDRQLEAAIEEELARQRNLENQIVTASASSAQAAGTQPAAASGQTPSAAPREKSATHQPPTNTSLASVNKTIGSQAPPVPFKNVEVRDINGDGVPDLWIYYNPQKPGEIMRQEEASKGDGRVDTWSYFVGGLLVRREVDTKGQGRPDAVFHYASDKIAREERDENGLGRMTYRATYENGRLAKVERETGGGGRSDFWVYYDTTKDGEAVIKEEKDLNGDGTVDLWTYYDNGRVVRRDTNIVGLEILSRQEQLPVLAAELKPPSPPGS